MCDRLSRGRRAGCDAPPGESRAKAGQGGRRRGGPRAIPGGGGTNVTCNPRDPPQAGVA